MNTFAFDENIRRQIKTIVDYANHNIYELDDMLDMMNGQMAVPEENPEHFILVPFGRWICYYLVEHPKYGRCHYFNLKPDATGRLPDKSSMEYLLKEFGIESPLLDKHITINKTGTEIKIVLPVNF